MKVVATLFPKQGKADEVVQLLQNVAKYVKDHEPGTTVYQITRNAKGADGTEEIVMIEEYADKNAIKIHGASEAFKDFQSALVKRDLMRAPPQLKILADAGGFSSRL